MAGSEVLKPVWEIVARAMTYLLIVICAFIGKEMVSQLKAIQADLTAIKLRLAVMESKSVTVEKVREIVESEVRKFHR